MQFNQAGNLSYTVCADGIETVKTISAPQNYRLEVEQLGRCILSGEAPHVTEAFTLRNSRVLQAILEKIGY